MWSDLKPKFKQYIRVKSYDDMLEEILCQMFIFENFPDTVSTRYIPSYLLREGLCAIWDVPDHGFEVTHCNLGGKPYPNGLGSIAICSTNNGIVRQFDDWVNNPNIVVMFNNRNITPDLNIGRYADMLAEVDLSMVFNVFFTRYMPIPVVDDVDTKKAVEMAFENLKTGKVQTVLHKDVLKELKDGKSSPIETINLTDVTNVDRLQYLSRFHEDLLRRFFNLNGMNQGGTGKAAQATSEETSSANGLSMIIPYSRWYEMQRSAKLLNEKFGWNVTIDFSEAWQYQFLKYKSLILSQNDQLNLDPDTLEFTEKTEDEIEETENSDNDETENSDKEEGGEDDGSDEDK